jgi:hypothetical protein
MTGRPGWPAGGLFLLFHLASPLVSVPLAYVPLLEALARASDRPAAEQVLLYLWTANAGDPLKLGPVVRIYNEGRHWIDLRTGPVGEDMPRMPLVVRAALPLSPEVSEARRGEE